MNGRLYRSRNDRIIAGVAGGLAMNLNIDPSIVRILWVVLVPLTGGFIILLYFVMAAIVPEHPTGPDTGPYPGQETGRDGWAAWERDQARPPDHGWTASGEDPTSAFEPVTPSLGSDAILPVAPPGTSPSQPGPLGPPSLRDAPRPAAGSDPREPGRRAWPGHPDESHDRGVPLVFGVILVLVGAFFLARSYLPDIDWGATWPILLVGIGIVLLVGSLRRPDRRP